VRSATDDYGALEDRYEYGAFGKPYKGDFSNGMGLGCTGNSSRASKSTPWGTEYQRLIC
jgi:hypothetical protein